MTSRNLRNYWKDGINDFTNEIDDNDNEINKKTSKSFEYEAKIIGSTPNNNNILDEEDVVSLKYLSNFSRSLYMRLVNCEIELDLRWTMNCFISEISRTYKAVGDSVEQEVATATTASSISNKCQNLCSSCLFVEKWL